ncbi:hypothetical protein MUP07_10950 [Candidatus Bathyarchaeota archaeon]|nr:hypothetical protein [Candidatus Bathyarchaeota archaeon]
MLVQTPVSEKRLYKDLLDPINYLIIINLTRAYPGGLSVSQLDSKISKTWSPTKRRVRLLEEQSLIRRISEDHQRKGVLYVATSRALFEWGVIEELLAQKDGTQRLALGLEQSFLYHEIPVQKEKLGLLAVLTAEFVHRGYFDKLRDEIFSPILVKHSVNPVDVATFFVKGFLRSGVYVKIFSRDTTSKLREEEIAYLFRHLKEQLSVEKMTANSLE